MSKRARPVEPAASMLRVRDWDRFQHYTDRNPPWIRLYTHLLDDYAFTKLPDAARWHAVGISLLAARHDNALPNDADWIAHRISAQEPVDLELLLSVEFLETCSVEECEQSASKRRAGRKQDAPPYQIRSEQSRERKHQSRQAEQVASGALAASGPDSDVVDADDFSLSDRGNGFRPNRQNEAKAARLSRDLGFYRTEFIRSWQRKREWPKNDQAAFSRFLEVDDLVMTPVPGSEHEAAQPRGELPQDRIVRAGSMDRIGFDIGDGVPALANPVLTARARLEADRQRADEWIAAHPEEAAQIRNRQELGIANDPRFADVRPMAEAGEKGAIALLRQHVDAAVRSEVLHAIGGAP